MGVYISIVSHGHGAEIAKINVLSSLSEDFTVVVKNNKPDDNLVNYLASSDIHLLDHDYGLGFGENNNIVF